MKYPDEVIERLSSQLHDVYQTEAKRQGDVRHNEKYQDLPENIKEYDRVLARWILANFQIPWTHPPTNFWSDGPESNLKLKDD